MALTTTTTAVTTSAALIGTPKNSRDLIVVTNPAGSGITVYVGGATVSSTNYAFALAAGDPPLIITHGAKDSLASLGWYIRGSGAGDVYVTVDAL